MWPVCHTAPLEGAATVEAITYKIDHINITPFICVIAELVSYQ